MDLLLLAQAPDVADWIGVGQLGATGAFIAIAVWLIKWHIPAKDEKHAEQIEKQLVRIDNLIIKHSLDMAACREVFRDESRAERHAFLDALNQQRLEHHVNLQKQTIQSDSAQKEAREFFANQILGYRDHSEKTGAVGFETMNNLSSEVRLLREALARVGKVELNAKPEK